MIASFSQPLDVLSFHQVNPIYDQIVQNYNMIFGFIATLISIITTFSIIGCINMAVSERTVEIGTLRALASPDQRSERYSLWKVHCWD